MVEGGADGWGLVVRRRDETAPNVRREAVERAIHEGTSFDGYRVAGV